MKIRLEYTKAFRIKRKSILQKKEIIFARKGEYVSLFYCGLIVEPPDVVMSPMVGSPMYRSCEPPLRSASNLPSRLIVPWLPRARECPVLNNKKILNDGLKKFSRHLSEMRDKFVHESYLPRFLHEPPRYVDKNRHIIKLTSLFYTKKLKDLEGIEIYQSTLTPKYLYNLVTNYLKTLFNDYLEEVK